MFYTHSSPQEFLELSPLCRLGMLRVTVIVITLRHGFGCTSVLTRFTKASCPDLETVEVVSLTSRRSAVPARSHPGSESSPSFDEVRISSLDEARDVCRGAHRPGFRPRSSELEADVEVLDHTNVPWASSIPAMWYYLLGLFRQCRSYWVYAVSSLYHPSRGSTEAGPWFGTGML